MEQQRLQIILEAVDRSKAAFEQMRKGMDGVQGLLNKLRVVSQGTARGLREDLAGAARGMLHLVTRGKSGLAELEAAARSSAGRIGQAMVLAARAAGQSWAGAVAAARDGKGGRFARPIIGLDGMFRFLGRAGAGFGGVLSGAVGGVGMVLGGIAGAVRLVIGGITGVLSLLGKVVGFAGPLLGSILGAVTGVVSGLARGVLSVAGALLRGLLSLAGNIASGILGALRGVFAAIQGLAAGVYRIFAGLLGKVFELAAAIGGVLFSAIGKAFGLLAKSAAAGAATLAAALAMIARSGVATNNTLESTSIGLQTLMRDSGKAAEYLKALRREATTSTFEFTDLAEWSKKMIAYGYSAKETMGLIRDVGDMAIAMGGNPQAGAALMSNLVDAFGKLKARGIVSEETMEPFMTAGLNVRKILGVEQGKGLGEAGITAEVAIPKMQRAIQEQFGGMQAKMAGTLPGIVSNIKDAFADLTATLTSGFTVQITKAAKALLGFLDAAGKSAALKGMQATFTLVGEAINRLAQRVPAVLDGFLRAFGKDNIGNFVRWFEVLVGRTMHFASLLPNIVGLVNRLLGSGPLVAFYGWWVKLSDLVLGLFTGGKLSGMGDALERIAASLTGLIRGVFGGLFAWLTELQNSGAIQAFAQKAAAWLNTVWQAAVAGGQWLINHWGYVWETIVTVFRTGVSVARTILEAFGLGEGALEKIGGVLSGFVQALPEMAKRFEEFANGDAFKKFVEGVAKGVQEGWDWFKRFLDWLIRAWPVVLQVAGLAWDWFKGILYQGLDWIGKNWGRVWEEARKLFVEVWKQVGGMIAGVFAVFKQFVNSHSTARNAIQGVADAMLELNAIVFDAIGKQLFLWSKWGVLIGSVLTAVGLVTGNVKMAGLGIGIWYVAEKMAGLSEKAYDFAKAMRLVDTSKIGAPGGNLFSFDDGSTFGKARKEFMDKVDQEGVLGSVGMKMPPLALPPMSGSQLTFNLPPPEAGAEWRNQVAEQVRETLRQYQASAGLA